MAGLEFSCSNFIATFLLSYKFTANKKFKKVILLTMINLTKSSFANQTDNFIGIVNNLTGNYYLLIRIMEHSK